jgi:ornithine decarboxylase
VSRAPDFKALVAQHGSPLLLLDCAVIRRQYLLLQRALPGVRLFYALKPLPQPAVVAELRDLGGCFDVATTGEIKLVKAAGVTADRCIHTHPIKTDADIRAALRFGIDTFVVDNPDETAQVRATSQARRSCCCGVSFRDPTAVVDLSRKFGCEAAAVPPLLELARSLGVTRARLLVPRRFAGGRPAPSTSRPSASARTHRPCARGSGWPGSTCSTSAAAFRSLRRRDVLPIREFCAADPRGAETACRVACKVIAEPGRFIAGPAGTAVATVVGRAQREGRWWYYLDDGMYGSYNGQLYDHATYPIEVLDRDGPLHPSVLAGPTCDSIDVMREDLPLPELQIGDLVVGRMMGAYTCASATDFNFIPRARIVALNCHARLKA